MTSGALHSILTDGDWTPQRAHNVQTNINGECLLVGANNARVTRRWWECPVLNKATDLGLQHLNRRRLKEDNKP
eukprot:13307979-Heterocapsa_arctica.AAC.1